MSDKNQMTCASCGCRRDQHGAKQTKGCPRFVPSGNYTGINPSKVKLSYPAMYGQPWQWEILDRFEDAFGDRLPPKDPVEKLEYQIKDMQAKFTRLLQDRDLRFDHLSSKLAALEKSIANISWDPVHHRATEKVDYTQWRDEEDNLTDTERGPVPKERTIF